MHLAEVFRRYLGWCPDRGMIRAREQSLPCGEMNSPAMQAGDVYMEDGVIVDYGTTGISFRFFTGLLIGAIGVIFLFIWIIPVAMLFRSITGILFPSLILSYAIVQFFQDRKKSVLWITRDALAIRRFLRRPVIIPRDTIATVEVRDNVPPLPVRVQKILFLLVVPVFAAGALYGRYLELVSGEIGYSSFLLYLGFYLCIVLFFLVIFHHSGIRSSFSRILVVTTTAKKLAGIYGGDPEKIAGMLGRSA
ncbi:MAG: hypothetical protein LUQ25_09920 [Methanoregulaceae archaeon]|nr:hypothetical protein [Methanoregulaceae archaeon]